MYTTCSVNANRAEDFRNSMLVLKCLVSMKCYSILLLALPSAWHPQNVAALLINCGDKVILKVLTSKAINNRFDEVVCLAHHLLVVSFLFQLIILYNNMFALEMDKRIKVEKFF